MIKITFIQPDGSRETYAGRVGETIMDVALDNGVRGIKAQCGGGCTCCTCHCWVAEPWVDSLSAPHQDELDMLEYAWGLSANSRLACQVFLSESLDGAHINVPEQQS